MNSTMSGWSALRMTILAARRVLPPDLMPPAKASKPFIKLSGPLAVPPPERVSVEPRRGERFVPVPLPHLKSMPSVLARVRMESSESLTELMKQAEHWGFVYPVTPNSTCCVCGFQCQLRPSELGSMRSHPTLNQTGELKAAYWRTGVGEGWGGEWGGGCGDAAHELAGSGLAFGSAGLAVQVFRGHDVGGGHGPVFGDFDVFLLEDD